jgi:sulfur-oxidizing protein SoxX
MPRLPHACIGFVGLVATALVAATSRGNAQDAAKLVPFQVAGDAIVEPLGGLRGDATRGRALVLDRSVGNCLICHRAPEPAERFMGEVGPDLSGVGSRLTQAQLRLRVVDQSLLNAKTVMPPYYRTARLSRVAERYRGKPVLDAQQVEDVVAYLMSLKS